MIENLGIMNFETEPVTAWLKEYYDIESAICKNLSTLANYAIEVTAPSGHFALKIYNPASRIAAEVQWEIDLTLHLIKNDAPVAKPVAGRDDGYLQSFIVDGREYVAVLFEWAAGKKPNAEHRTYVLLGESAALIHNAADSFVSDLPREEYDTATLIDERLERMKASLVESGEWQRVFDLTERLRKIIVNPNLDYGICHMDLTLDNIHRNDEGLTVFDLDSAGKCWRAYEPYGVRQFSEDYFKAWLEGYRSARPFSQENERAVAAFVIIGDIGNTVWKLGLARSSRGEPLLQIADLPGIVEGWLKWEQRLLGHETR